MKSTENVVYPQASIDALDHLDHGHFRDAVALVDQRAPSQSDAADRLWHAEVRLYLDQLDAAAALVDSLQAILQPHLRDASPAGACARRRHLIAAEIAYFRGQYERAVALANEALEASEATADDQHQMRATFDSGRTLRRRAEYATSLETLLIASHRAERGANAFYGGMIAYNRAICCYELCDYERLNEYIAEARESLQASEGLRYFALAENLRGLVLTELGDVAGGMAVFNEAERIASSLGITSDLLSIANNAARALIATQKNEEAEKRLVHLIDWDSPASLTMAHFYSLCLLSIAQAAQGKIREARRSAQIANDLAASYGNEDDRFEAGILLLRARALSGEEAAIEELRAKVTTADARGTEYQRVQARIYLAHALVAESPIEATNYCREVRGMAVVPTGSWLLSELERVEFLLARAPIRIDEQDRLIIETNLSWPTIKAAREAAERYIYERAMSATRGNASAAGRLIGESRYQMHHLGRILRGEAPRPSRSKDPDAAAKKPIRRRSRIQFQ